MKLNIIMSELTSVHVQFHKDARDTQDLLKRLDTEVNQKYNPEFKDVYQMESLISDLDVSITAKEAVLPNISAIIRWLFFICLLLSRTNLRLWITLMNGLRLCRSGACRFCL